LSLIPAASAITFALRNESESALLHPCASIFFLYGIAFVAEYRSTAGAGRGGSQVAMHHPWRPRSHELVCVASPLFIALHFNTAHLFCSPAALASWLRFSERLVVVPLDFLLGMITTSAHQARTPWVVVALPFRTWCYFSVNPAHAVAPWAALLRAAGDSVAAMLVVLIIDYKQRTRFQAASAAAAAAANVAGEESKEG
jgi:hypothetical protein